jgi:hypothetical protein
MGHPITRPASAPGGSGFAGAGRVGSTGGFSAVRIVRDVAGVELKQREIIVPVLGRESPDATVQQFGTGSIIGDGSILLYSQPRS